ncbi:uncharacterized protein LOC105171092 [Sesamum indicum]|uniref:Uncharacterized protein LOC105171092 n=1 Tax=Sesamum indicum TaxID=4182 RepID=A0A6I9TWB3_SESIN|nr:uncharacterized protein LOC105171092 [Sesamum indicum]
MTPTLHPQTLHQYPPSLPQPPPTTAPRRRNVQNQAEFSMRLTDLSLRRITAASPFQFRFNHHHHHHHNQRPSSLTDDLTSIYPKSMADESKKTHTQPENAVSTTTTLKVKDEKQKESEKSMPPVPPPPEKPLPGDCCGSGCVRCVWDVYYEELEEYNRLYKAN